ncbi:HTH-type transcriptional regulator MhqR [Vibrio aerogenes CECT 7868]|uniref:HTH-type transcriptional regulator MhqR n=1 Tax=Vibrio aerogenes CECT 7868 TaxID=1216006 RepID=A0A1M5ZQ25_9VIBR|nr:MarR family transcriptional regulator [Vibrio aerogenes]SHI26304.1 HTH-type transcriptional regulator MhqR [Vibrio aerogenes CECT 7868]
MNQDHVDRILAQWRSVHPELDCSAMGIIGRIRRVSRLFDESLKEVFRQHMLSNIEFDILATLRRTDAPLTPTALYQTLMLSSGAMSTRLEKLVQRGLIERIASEDDRRSNQVQLTDAGKAQVDAALQDHLSNMAHLLSGLTKEEQEQLADLNRKLLLSDALQATK